MADAQPAADAGAACSGNTGGGHAVNIRARRSSDWRAWDIQWEHEDGGWHPTAFLSFSSQRDAEIAIHHMQWAWRAACRHVAEKLDRSKHSALHAKESVL